jgi:hypothetical protein
MESIATGVSWDTYGWLCTRWKLAIWGKGIMLSGSLTTTNRLATCEEGHGAGIRETDDQNDITLYVI